MSEQLSTLIWVHDAARRGAQLLDARGPSDWRIRINLPALTMDDVVWCVLGQLYGTYRDGMRALDIERGMSQHYGFNITDEKMLVLREAWVELLTQSGAKDDAP